MDSQDIFRKLSVGAKFNFKKFKTDAQKLQLAKVKPQPIIKNDVMLQESEPDTSRLKKELDLVTHIQDDEITLLGSMTTTAQTCNEGIKKKKPKQIVSAKEKSFLLKREEIRRFRNLQHISVLGKDVPAPIDSFESLGRDYKVSQVILDNLAKCGLTAPTPIQMQAMPIMLERRQVLACAPTGSGKTAAFLVPVLNHLGGPKRKGFRAVVVCPTRELARQTYRESLLLAEGLGLRIHIISKVSHATDKFGPKSSKRFDVLITTPNRLIYLLRQEPPAIELRSVEWLVVDESDKLFEAGPQGFREQLAEIYRACDSDTVCRAMFSATHLPDVARWAKQNLKRLVTVAVGQRNTAADTVSQELLYVGDESGKLVAMRNLVQSGGLTPPVLVFVQSKQRARELFHELIYDGINVDVIHADRTQTERDNAVRCFREGKTWVLICTELMGRGVDFKGVNLVVNYDFPPSAVAYIHRVGRTGRAGRAGRAVTFFTEDDSVTLRSIAQVMKDSGCEVPSYMLGMKKPSKRDRRKLEQRAPSRGTISTVPVHERRRKERLKNVIKNNKRKKLEGSTTSSTKKAKTQDT